MKKIIEIKNIDLKYKFVQNMSLKQEIMGIFFKNKRRKKQKEIFALKNVSLAIESGYTVGIIGGNGAGKSTLLKLIAGVFQPDSGEVITKTDSISLLSLGTGFNSELTGIENIYLNGMLLGLKKNQIYNKIEEIIKFSGIEGAINNPIKSYSTGMKQRLAFAIAINAIPNVLLIDEVLGVGDQSFQNKSSKIIKNLITSKKTVILVSHSLGTIKELCDKVIWLHKGELIKYGNTEDILDEYRNFIRKQK